MTTEEPDRQVTHERESERLERFDKLEAELRDTVEETERLRAELKAERDRRRKLEVELDRVREEADEKKRGWLPW